MSERKTAEIKFRIQPSVKALWQEAAARECDGNLSELITRRMNGIDPAEFKARVAAAREALAAGGEATVEYLRADSAKTIIHQGSPPILHISDAPPIGWAEEELKPADVPPPPDGCRVFWKGCPEGKCVCVPAVESLLDADDLAVIREDGAPSDLRFEHAYPEGADKIVATRTATGFVLESPKNDWRFHG